MRTSYAQFAMMVDFMERNGDLSKPSSGPRGRHWCLQKWQELAKMLNSDGTGDSRSEEKWRKMLSTGNVGDSQIPSESIAGTGTDDIETEEIQYHIVCDEGWNLPGPSSETTILPSAERTMPTPSIEPTPASIEPTSASTQPTQPLAPTKKWTPPSKRTKEIMGSQADMAAKAFLESDKYAREIERERNRMFFELERERIRQRDIELQLQAQWLEFMKQALSALMKLVEEKNRDNE